MKAMKILKKIEELKKQKEEVRKTQC